MIAVAIGFASTGLLLLTLGLLIRKGRTWLIAGYDPSRVREVREAEAEYAAGDAARFDDMEQLLDELRT